MRVACIQNCETEGFGQMEGYFAENGIECLLLRAWEETPLPSIDGFDAVVVGGTPLPAYDIKSHGFLLREWDFLQDALERQLPCLGICFGAQILARLLGAEARRNEAMEIGGYEARLTDAGKSSRLFSGFPECFPVFQWHGDTFDIPPGADLLAVGDACINQAFGCGNVVGLQFHLEVAREDVGIWTEAYEGDLVAVGKDAGRVIAEYREREEAMRPLFKKMMSNFFAEV